MNHTIELSLKNRSHTFYKNLRILIEINNCLF